MKAIKEKNDESTSEKSFRWYRDFLSEYLILFSA